MPKSSGLLPISASLVLVAIGGIALCAGSVPKTPSDLNLHPTQYKGQDVLVQGYVVLNASLHALYESDTLHREFRIRIGKADPSFNPREYSKYCLTIGNPEVMARIGQHLDGKTLVLKGKFVENYLDGSRIDMGSCPLRTAIMIDEAYLRERFAPP